MKVNIVSNISPFYFRTAQIFRGNLLSFNPSFCDRAEFSPHELSKKKWVFTDYFFCEWSVLDKKKRKKKSGTFKFDSWNSKIRILNQKLSDLKFKLLFWVLFFLIENGSNGSLQTCNYFRCRNFLLWHNKVLV